MYEKIIYYSFAIVHHGNCDTKFCLSHACNRAFTFTLSGHYHRGKVPIPQSGLISVGRFRVLSRVLIRIQRFTFVPTIDFMEKPKPRLIELLCFLFLFGENVYVLYLSKNKVFKQVRAKPSLLCKLLIFIGCK
jgi:hypothetical protein